MDGQKDFQKFKKKLTVLGGIEIIYKVVVAEKKSFFLIVFLSKKERKEDNASYSDFGKHLLLSCVFEI